MWYDTQSSVSVCFFSVPFSRMKHFFNVSFLSFVLFSGRDQNMGNNATTMSFSLSWYGYAIAFVSSAISHGRTTKSNNNVLSRPKMYLYTHFKVRERERKIKKFLANNKLYFHMYREKELFIQKKVAFSQSSIEKSFPSASIPWRWCNADNYFHLDQKCLAHASWKTFSKIKEGR